MPPESLHHEAHLMEHLIDREESDALDEVMGHPALDPHGDPIPRPGGGLAAAAGTPLSAWPVGAAGRVSHVEDEPEPAYAELVRLGFAPGQVVTVLERGADALRVRVDGEEREVPAQDAELVQVVEG
jgi:DtxR family Mn-dependent transcriptional regulator